MTDAVQSKTDNNYVDFVHHSKLDDNYRDTKR